MDLHSPPIIAGEYVSICYLLGDSRFRRSPNSCPSTFQLRMRRGPNSKWSARIQYQSRMDAVCRVVHCVVMRGESATERLLLSVVDDDEMLRESLPDLLREFGFAARAFSSGQDFLSSDYVDETSCLILDVAMPGMSGLDLQEELKRRGQVIPIIFITGQKDEDIRNQAFRQGAVKFLYKPFSDSDLLDAVNAALDVE